jgi:hypothetical protein
MISQKMKRKKNVQESNLWPHVSLLATFVFFLFDLNLKSFGFSTFLFELKYEFIDNLDNFNVCKVTLKTH